ncbi:hypothetical protein CLOM_g16580, partial [Closterium sp. NIES-68]
LWQQQQGFLLQGRVFGLGLAVQGKPLSSLLQFLFIRFLLLYWLARPPLHSLLSSPFLLTTPRTPSPPPGRSLGNGSKSAAEPVAEQQQQQQGQGSSMGGGLLRAIGVCEVPVWYGMV